MHQYLCYIAGFPIRMYGLTLCTAILLATGVGYFLAYKDGRWHEHCVDLGIYGGFAGIIGGRLWDVFFFDWDYYGEHLLEIPFVWQGGMAVQGGIIGGILAGLIYCHKHKIDSVALLDIVTPAIVIGQAVGRIANLLNGDAFGAPTGGNFGLVYPPGTLAYQVYGSTPLWPAEVWECQGDIVIFALLLIYQTTKYGRGQVFCLYAMLYSALRIFLETMRGDYVEPLFLGLKSAQATSACFFLVAAVFFLYAEYRKRKIVRTK